MLATLLARTPRALLAFVLLEDRISARKARHLLRLSDGSVIDSVPAKIVRLPIALANTKRTYEFDHGAGSLTSMAWKDCDENLTQTRDRVKSLKEEGNVQMETHLIPLQRATEFSQNNETSYRKRTSNRFCCAANQQYRTANDNDQEIRRLIVLRHSNSTIRSKNEPPNFRIRPKHTARQRVSTAASTDSARSGPGSNRSPLSST